MSFYEDDKGNNWIEQHWINLFVPVLLVTFPLVAALIVAVLFHVVVLLIATCHCNQFVSVCVSYISYPRNIVCCLCLRSLYDHITPFMSLHLVLVWGRCILYLDLYETYFYCLLILYLTLVHIDNNYVTSILTTMTMLGIIYFSCMKHLHTVFVVYEWFGSKVIFL